MLFRHRHDLGAVTQYPIQRRSQPRSHLILFLSDLKRVGPHEKGVPRWFCPNADNPDEAATKRTGELVEDLLRLMRHKPGRIWPWEMPLRAIHHHMDKLEDVTIVCSSESVKDAHHFTNLCHEYFPHDRCKVAFYVWARNRDDAFGRIQCGPQMGDVSTEWRAFDFEDLTALSQAISGLLDEFSDQRVEDRDIVIDFTSGQKTTSIVAACVTFNRRIRAQYVRTDGRFERPGDDVISYDLSIDPVSAGMG
jgi:hypothetical protein